MKERIVVVMGENLAFWHEGGGVLYCLIKEYNRDGDCEDENGRFTATYKRQTDGKLFRDVSSPNINLYTMELEEIYA